MEDSERPAAHTEEAPHLPPGPFKESIPLELLSPHEHHQYLSILSNETYLPLFRG